MAIVRMTALALLLAACGGQQDHQTNQDASPAQPQLANPASVFCVEEMGGRLEIEQGADGARGICHLPDGSAVDEWELYRSHNS